MEARRLGLIGQAKPNGHLKASWDFPAELAAAGTARTLTRQVLSRWRVLDPADIDDVVLIVDELISNAIVHGSGPVRLALSVTGQMLTGEITDCSPLVPAAPVPSVHEDFEAESGRGLFLVSLLSADFGSRASGQGKTVWFTRLLTGLPA